MYDNVIQDEGNSYSKFFTSVFTWMFIGLLVTAATACGVVSTGIASVFLLNPLLIWVFFIAELVLVFYISRNTSLENIAPGKIKTAFIIYSIVNGITFSTIFFVYEIGLIYKAFIGNALMFGVMALYGSYTKADLSKFASIGVMGLIGIIIMTIINGIFSFWGRFSTGLDIFLGYATLVIFLGLTAWDIQKLKMMYEYTNDNENARQGMAVYGALNLYLDFINLLLSLLRISGSRD